MLGKLFKYEWRSITKLLLPIHGCVLLFALLSRFYFTLGGGVENLLNSSSGIISVLTGLLIFALVVIISSVVIFTYVYIGYHFYKKVFTDQGYLTNTLPVTPTQLLLSKELAAVPWLLIDILIIIISCLIFSRHERPILQFSSCLACYAQPDGTDATTYSLNYFCHYPFTISDDHYTVFQCNSRKPCLYSQSSRFHCGLYRYLYPSADLWIHRTYSNRLL